MRHQRPLSFYKPPKPMTPERRAELERALASIRHPREPLRPLEPTKKDPHPC